MSYEAWGDGDQDDNTDHLLDAGWWPSEQANAVLAAIKDLDAEPIYEDGQMSKGISPRFLMRMTILKYEAGLLPHDDPLVKEAEAALFPPHHTIGAKDE